MEAAILGQSVVYSPPANPDGTRAPAVVAHVAAIADAGIMLSLATGGLVTGAAYSANGDAGTWRFVNAAIGESFDAKAYNDDLEEAAKAREAAEASMRAEILADVEAREKAHAERELERTAANKRLADGAAAHAEYKAAVAVGHALALMGRAIKRRSKP